MPATALTALLDAAETARTARLSAGLKPLPAQWAHGEPLRVGDKVAFTGDSELRDELEQRAERLGVRVMGNVSRRTALLVTCGDFTGTKAKSAASLGTRCVPPEDFAVLLEHLQPAARPTPAPQRTPKLAPTPPAVNAVAVPTVSPAEMRAWARTNGYEVSDRGRVPADVVAAYKEAHP
ncbi:Lsr2 family DNA-binding protein [Actinokineospora bangkokensis]|uniref:Uncharacterized protein n=1 Tax=Actinokineospora bangkokensis TaxID=1193682 RepID=A0A1Q9LNI5_9PSEU|nr:histone-like nucleoid-structuring protein Lsr2 [Actinokineospora bangkokensis]OLR93563.1 hypothetical protein BJP25_14825 [Actinokineospora bangkokensis]